jgi:cold shock CspA family protein
MRHQSKCVRWLFFLGFGFLEALPEMDNRQIYISAEDLPARPREQRKLHAGETVEFELELNAVGPRARNVTIPADSAIRVLQSAIK